jgi:hypothetical protein
MTNVAPYIRELFLNALDVNRLQVQCEVRTCRISVGKARLNVGNLKVLVPIGMTDDDLCGQHAILAFLAKNDDRIPKLRALCADPLSYADRYRVRPRVQGTGLAGGAMNLKLVVVHNVLAICLSLRWDVTPVSVVAWAGASCISAIDRLTQPP